MRRNAAAVLVLVLGAAPDSRAAEVPDLRAATWLRFADALPAGTRVKVVLRDGRTLKGAVKGAGDGAVTVEHDGREVAVPATTIETMRRGQGARKPLVPTPGERVRVVTRDGRLEGTLTSLDGEVLSLLEDGQPDARRISRGEMKSLAIAAGPRSVGKRIKRGALLGLAAGMAVGIAYSAIASPCWSEPGRCEQNALSGIFFGTIFSVLTVPVGSVVSVAAKGERWQKVERPGLTLAVEPRKRGATVGLRLRF